MSINAVSASSSSSSSNLTLEDFLKVMLTQLTHQNPLKPMDNEAFMAQIAQFTALKQTQEMNANIQTLANNQSALQSVGLIGKTVEVSTNSGTITGTVSRLSLLDALPSISVTQSNGAVVDGIGISQILTVH